MNSRIKLALLFGMLGMATAPLACRNSPTPGWSGAGGEDDAGGSADAGSPSRGGTGGKSSGGGGRQGGTDAGDEGGTNASGAGPGDAAGGMMEVGGANDGGQGDAGSPSAAGAGGEASAELSLRELPVGLRQVARTFSVCDIVQDRDGSFLFSEIAGSFGSRIRRLSADLEQITTLAGAIENGDDDGPIATARFDGACGLAFDADDNLYVADSNNGTIRKITPDGIVSTLAGTAGMTTASVDGTGEAARFMQPFKVALGPDDALYVADVSSHRIRRVTLEGVVTTYAGGNGATIEPGYVNGAPDIARFSGPRDVAVTENGDVYVADSANGRIRKIVRSGATAGSVETFAGNGQTSGTTANADGVGTAAGIRYPTALALQDGALFVADVAGLVRRVDLDSAEVTTFTGSQSNQPGFADGAAGARLDLSEGLTEAADGSLFAVTHPGAVRRISPAGVVTTIVSNAQVDALGTRTTDDGVTRAHELFQKPSGVATDADGNAFVTDGNLRTVRRIAPDGQVSLLAGLAGSYHGGIDGLGSAAQFNALNAITLDAVGNAYVGDQFAVRKITPNGQVTTLAGSTQDFGALNDTGAAARFQVVTGLAVDSDGIVFASDSGNNAIRRIDEAGDVTTYAGALGTIGFANGGLTEARFSGPAGLSFGPDGTLYVADAGNCAIRAITTDGAVSTLAGGPGWCTGFGPRGIAVANDGSVYFTDPTTNAIGRVLPDGTITTVIAKSDDGTVHLGTAPRMYQPAAIALLGDHEIVVTTLISQVLEVTLP